MSDDPKLPASRPEPQQNEQASNHLYVGELNYHANDLSELRRLSEVNPELANKIVENQERASIREDRSFRLGLIVATVLALAMVGGGAYVVVGIGWWQTIVFVSVILGASHLLRTVLTGEFADTSWFGRFLSPKPPSDDDGN